MRCAVRFMADMGCTMRWVSSSDSIIANRVDIDTARLIISDMLWAT